MWRRDRRRVTLRCEECGVESTGKALGWRALLNGDPDEPTFVSTSCPECTEREFGPAPRFIQ